MTQPVPPPLAALDDNTRYLAAGAHLDRAFAEKAVREFLVEPTRQIPPSQGVDTTTVLTEALAARTRRKYRDGTLIVLGLIFLVFGSVTGMTAGWIAAAATGYAVRSWLRERDRNRVHRMAGLVRICALLLVAVTFGLFSIASFGLGSLVFADSHYDYEYDSAGSIFAVAWLIAPLCCLLMLAVLIADRLVVWQLTTGYFGRQARIPGQVGLPPADRLSLSLAPQRFRQQLERHRIGRQPSAPDARMPVTVFRGRNPFVGAGESTTPWSMAIPLEQDGTAETEEPLTAMGLYQRVADKMADLRATGTLSPDRRLRELRIGGAVFVAAEELIDHLHLPEAPAYLQRLDLPPETHLRDVEANRLFEQPREWSRYYLSLELETWDRELVVSAFLHAAIDRNALYLEWTPCVLAPIAERYRNVDKMVRGGPRPVGEGLLRWLLLPGTAFARLVNACRMLLPLPYDGYQLNADRYGTARTLRELAAMSEPRDYFQAVDARRYIQLLESRLVPAIVEVLREHGLSSVTFERQINVVTGNNVTISGSNNAPVLFGGTVHGDVTGRPTAERKP
ncbi:hypothetical protein [Amycolatopsis jiangsuensis]|uniref:Putative membrane protein n=1 Tax=Amycolatopsis jiangsuensis TaxID=1181879 RepID=A0A840IZG8_9PSEU|nr:hypothetical protein [Amycolatopsis jiangsuensis]MBB4688251.1 putative membrane protein [Amycolatopsis jiangsuensis]